MHISTTFKFSLGCLNSDNPNPTLETLRNEHRALLETWFAGIKYQGLDDVREIRSIRWSGDVP